MRSLFNLFLPDTTTVFRHFMPLLPAIAFCLLLAPSPLARASSVQEDLSPLAHKQAPPPGKNPVAGQRQAPEDEARREEQKTKASPPLSGFLAVENDNSLPTPARLKAMWDAVFARHDSERVFGNNQKYIKSFRRKEWNTIVAQSRGMPPDKKLRIVNGFFNNWPSKSDQENFGAKEHWASPEEFLGKGSGDCEDYAIIKYFALRYLGWPTEDLWLVLVVENAAKRQHAVLAARYGRNTFILDNLSNPRYLLIPEKDYMKRYTPFFAVNNTGEWLFAVPKNRTEQKSSPVKAKKENSLTRTNEVRQER